MWNKFKKTKGNTNLFNTDPKGDLLLFYSYLIYTMALKNSFTREDFQDVVVSTYNNLPVRGGGYKTMGYWENICKLYDVPLVYKRGENSHWLEESVIEHLADTMWLAYEHQRKLAANKTQYEDI